MSFKKRDLAVVTVTKKAENSLVGGHPWVYGEEITDTEGLLSDGELVDVVSQKNRFLGTGFYNSNSKIRVRVISRNTNDKFDAAFFERRIKYAWDYRKTVMRGDTDCCRVIFGEADTFPGLTVDKFHDILVVQTLSLGIERRKELIFSLLYKVLTEDGAAIRGIYERNDVAIRELEGLTQNKGFFMADESSAPIGTTVRINENGILYDVDFENGQKTGFFLDQKYNRLAVSRLAYGRRVLDCFTHTGSFALNAVKGGAESVCAVDISKDAIAMAQHNAEINGFIDKMSFKCENVFDLLTDMPKDEKYDFIILDPPAFTKSRSTVGSASRGYKDINLLAMKLLRPGGILATFSCSGAMSPEFFDTILSEAATDAALNFQIIARTGHAIDHPVALPFPEGRYLKGVLLRRV